MNFSERFKTLREDHHLTQFELSKYLNISRSCISMIEIGRNDPTASTLLAYANYFQISTDFLLCREDDFGNITIQSEGESLTSQEKELLDGFRSLSPGTQEMILRVLTGAIQTERKKA